MPTHALGFPFWSRSEWELPGQLISGPATRGDRTKWAIVHYEGSTSGITIDAVQWLRNAQHFYLTERGYSLGYGWLVVHGQAFQIRGAHPEEKRWFNMASNPGRLLDQGNLNDDSVSIIFGHGVDGEIPAEDIDVAVKLLRWAGFRGRPTPHSEVDPTGCPGPVARRQIADGLLDVGDTVVAPPPTEPEEDPTMNLVMFSTQGRNGTILLGAGSPVFLSPALASHYRGLGVPKVVGADVLAENARWDQLARLAGGATGGEVGTDKAGVDAARVPPS